MRDTHIFLTLILAIVLGGCVRPPQLARGSVWRTFRATQRVYEKMPSFGERARFAAEFPYWEPLDSSTLARINAELAQYRPWKPDFREMEDSFPSFIAGCRDADAHGNYYFEFPLDTIVKYSPFRGTREEVIDLECHSLASGSWSMIRGTDRSGRAVSIYLGEESDGTCYVMSDNHYFIHHAETGEEYMQDWLNYWKPKVIPPPLPNWPRRIRERYEQGQGK